MKLKELMEIINNEQYAYAMRTIKAELQENSENSELWYYLFLAENKNYIGTDFDNIIDELSFSKALEYGNRRLRNSYEAEYNLYKTFSYIPGMREAFRYAYIKKFDKSLDFIKNLDVSHYDIPDDVQKEFYSNLDYIVDLGNNPLTVDMNIVLANLLYLKTEDKELESILLYLIDKATEMDSTFKDTGISLDYDSLKEKIYFLEKAYKIHISGDTNAFDMELALKRLFMTIDGENFDSATDQIARILDHNPEYAKGYLYELMIKNKLKTLEDLAKIKNLTSNSNYLAAYKYATEEERIFMAGLSAQYEAYTAYDIAYANKDSNNLEKLADAYDKFKTYNTVKDATVLADECEKKIQKMILLEARKKGNGCSSQLINTLSKYKSVSDEKTYVESYNASIPQNDSSSNYKKAYQRLEDTTGIFKDEKIISDLKSLYHKAVAREKYQKMENFIKAIQFTLYTAICAGILYFCGEYFKWNMIGGFMIPLCLAVFAFYGLLYERICPLKVLIPFAILFEGFVFFICRILTEYTIANTVWAMIMGAAGFITSLVVEAILGDDIDHEPMKRMLIPALLSFSLIMALYFFTTPIIENVAEAVNIWAGFGIEILLVICVVGIPALLFMSNGKRIKNAGEGDLGAAWAVAIFMIFSIFAIWISFIIGINRVRNMSFGMFFFYALSLICTVVLGGLTFAGYCSYALNSDDW